MNITAAVPAWNRPLIPEEIRTNPDFSDLLRAELRSAQKTPESYWISKDKAVPNVLSESGEVIELIGCIRDLGSIFRPDAADSMVEKLTSVQIKARTTLSAVNK